MRWLRPSGSEIETNDEKTTIDGCLKLGWEPLDGEIPVLIQEDEQEDSQEEAEPLEDGPIQLEDGTWQTEFDGETVDFESQEEAIQAYTAEQERVANGE